MELGINRAEYRYTNLCWQLRRAFADGHTYPCMLPACMEASGDAWLEKKKRPHVALRERLQDRDCSAAWLPSVATTSCAPVRRAATDTRGLAPEPTSTTLLPAWCLFRS